MGVHSDYLYILPELEQSSNVEMGIKRIKKFFVNLNHSVSLL